ncbi:MAG: DUF819 family protein [Sphingomonadales bacterium]
MIDAANTYALWAVLISIVAFGIWSERTKIGRRLTGTIVVLLSGLFLSNIGIIPTAAPVYGTVMGSFIPLGLALLLLRVDLRTLKTEAGPTLIIFMIGAVGTVLGAIVAFYLLTPQMFPAELAGMFAATYIGGSANFAAVADAFAVTDSAVIVPAIASDTLITIAYLIVLGTVPGLSFFTSRRGKKVATETLGTKPGFLWGTQDMNLLAIVLSLGLAFSFVVIGNFIQGFTEIRGVSILVVTVLALLAGTFFKEQIKPAQGPFQLGMILLLIFFAALGASGDLSTLITHGPQLLVFAATIMLVHFVITFGVGWLLKFDIAEIATASNACVCGPPTAAGMAADAGWDHLVTPAIVAGSLGFAIANIAGVFVVNILS